MTIAVIGLGHIGHAVAKHLADGGIHLVVATRHIEDATQRAQELGDNVEAMSIEDAIDSADTVVFAVMLDGIETDIKKYHDKLVGKVVVDPSNPIKPNGGSFSRTLPDNVSAGETIKADLPANVHYVKAFGTLSAEHLANLSNQQPRIALLYATDDERAETEIKRLITAMGFAPVKAGGVDKAIEIEVGGKLHEMGGFANKAPTEEQAREAVAKLG